EQILLIYNAFLTVSIHSAFCSFTSDCSGPYKTLLAFVLSSFKYEIQRANTDSVINGKGTPNSSALMLVHLPVPFLPALSRITSSNGLLVSSSCFVKISAVISTK